MTDENEETRNVFESQKSFPSLPVTIFVGNERKTIGMAAMVEHDGHIHVSMDLNGDPELVKAFLGENSLDVSIAEEEVQHEETIGEEAGWHRPPSHKPATNFGFPKPPGPIHEKSDEA